jgi:hypothetical protein
VAHLGVDLSKTDFKVGMDEGKRKAKSLYLVPGRTDEKTFSFEKAAESYTLALPFIFKKSGVDYAQTKYDFTIRFSNMRARLPELAAPKCPTRVSQEATNPSWSRLTNKKLENPCSSRDFPVFYLLTTLL